MSGAPLGIIGLMDLPGAPGAGLAFAPENLFPPIPSEVVLPLARFAASTGRPGLLASLLWTTAGSVVGALPHHRVGTLLGRDRSTRAPSGARTARQATDSPQPAHHSTPAL